MTDTDTDTDAGADTDVRWEAPGPGSWVCDRSHTSPGPTPVYRRIVSRHTEPTYRAAMKRYGGAIGSIDMQFVNGALYRRLVPLVAPDRDNGKVPPAPVLWLVTRLHPEFRRREKVAADVLSERRFLDDVRTWVGTERFEWIDRNRELQAVPVDELDDHELADHLRTLDERLVAGWHRHHELHANDLGPIGDLLAHAQAWGLDSSEVMALLKGSSPATAHASVHGSAIAEALSLAGVDAGAIATVDEIRAVPEASAALDAYLDEFGWRLISDYDIEGSTLHELPNAVVANVRAAAADSPGTAGAETPSAEIGAAEAELQAKAGDPQLFASLLDSAREAYGVRDDNGPLTWAWPAGLVRRAYLEAASRLAERNRIDRASNVFELDIPELADVLDGATEPTLDAIVDRAAFRAYESTLEAPDVLGPPPVEPDLAPLPPAIRRVMGIIVAAVSMLDPEEGDDATSDRNTPGLSGLGIGTSPYRGTARVADDAAKAIDEMQPGDVLVAPWTAPSFNAVLAIAGGVVVQEGGLLSHAAVMARELGIPAVVGCAGAMTAITTGDTVEVDPAAGRVSIVQPATADA